MTTLLKYFPPPGWLLPGHDPLERIANISAACGDPDPSFKRTYREVFNLESFHALPHNPALKLVMKMLVGEQVLIHPKPIGRLIFPNCEHLTVHPHQDYRFMNGDPECFTVWIPLHDCPTDVGPLQYWRALIVSAFRNMKTRIFMFQRSRPEKRWEAMGRRPDQRWRCAYLSQPDRACGLPEPFHKIRISLDCRFQDSGRASIRPTWRFAGESGKSWESIYAQWRSNDLKYYWKKLSLKFPALQVRDGAARKNGGIPIQARARYARILSQID